MKPQAVVQIFVDKQNKEYKLNQFAQIETDVPNTKCLKCFTLIILEANMMIFGNAIFVLYF